PYANDWFWNVRGNIETTVGRYEDALASLRRMKLPTPWSYGYQAICHVELGRMTEAGKCIERFRQLLPGIAVTDYFAVRPYASAISRRMDDALRRAETAVDPGIGA